jgi:tRNA pseudouridine55 synthase
MLNHKQTSPFEGILLIDKAKGSTSFQLVRILRRLLGVKKIGHAGTLDPFATGVVVLLVGRSYTKLAQQLLSDNKEYIAEVFLGTTTDSYDIEGNIIGTSAYIPRLEEIQKCLQDFQGEIDQIPPMFSAKKRQGKKLYELARQGIEIPRDPIKIWVEISLLRYEYPYLELKVLCSKGTYIRSLGHDIGKQLGCGAHLSNLRRIRSGNYVVEDCVHQEDLPQFLQKIN